MKWNSKEILIAFIHAAVMIVVIILPTVATLLNVNQIEYEHGIELITTQDWHEVIDTLMDSTEYFIPLFILYLLSYYWIVPKYYYANKPVFFAITIILSIAFALGYKIIDDGFFWNDRRFNASWAFFLLHIDTVMYLLATSCALAVRSIMRLHTVEMQLQETKQQHAEAELVWLKNQLNPHFLFNTLNNISSLVQIDADTAQDSITQLSDLLRYALYETNKTEVNLADEVDFMDNYIHLMKLRFSDKVKVETRFEVPEQPVSIAPMLFISTLENAFKHGVSSHDESFIKASLHMEGDRLVFCCDNSYFPKKTDGRTGKGVGIENLKRRLNLLYPERNSYTQTLEDKVYHVVISIKV